MKREFWVTIAVIILLLGSVFFKLFWQRAHLPQTSVADRGTQIAANPGYAQIAAHISANINEISPTSSFGDTGWLAQRISFSATQPLAYVIYTDTHIVLRLLVSYEVTLEAINTKVLATFLPVGEEAWQLQFGEDEAAGQRLIDYVYNGDSKQWIPQELISK